MSFVLGSLAVYKTLSNKLRDIALIKKLLRLNIAFQFGSGIALALSTNAGFLSTCAKLGLYLAFYVGVEGVIYLAAKRLEVHIEPKSA